MLNYFRKYFKNLIRCNIIVGIYATGLPDEHKTLNMLFFLYCLFTSFISFSQVISCVTVLYDYTANKNFVHTASIFSIYLTALIFNGYIIFNHGKIESLINKLNKVINFFLIERIMGKQKYENNLLEKYRVINKITKISVVSLAFLVCSNNTNKLLRGWCLFGMDGEKLLNYQIPYEADYSPLYEFTILVQAFGLFMSCSQLVCVNSLFVTFFYILSTCFNQLQETIASFSTDVNCNDYNDDNSKKSKHKINYLSKDAHVTTEMSNTDMSHDNINEKFLECDSVLSDRVLCVWISIHKEVLM